MTRAEIIAKAEALGPWYHAIEILPGYFTPSHMVEGNLPYWDAVRRVRSSMDYRGRVVLDMASYDGMWAFEAEKLGTQTVVASDIWDTSDPDCQIDAKVYERFQLARSLLRSRVFDCPNANAHHLSSRLAIPPKGGFEIIQCLGMLYHVENPILALREIRKCLTSDGLLLLETAIWAPPEVEGLTVAPLVRLNCDNGVYYDPTTYWVPNLPALEGMLKIAGFEKHHGYETVITPQPNDVSSRIVMVCKKA